MAAEQEDDVATETGSLFAQVIQEHLELKRRNSALEHELPIDKYLTDDPFSNHPLFKSEEQARVEDTMDGQQSIVDEPTQLDWPTSENAFTPAPASSEYAAAAAAAEPSVDGDATEEHVAATPPPSAEPVEEQSDESLWSRSRDFDWGD
ncbi:MAG: hypothetical protein F2663_07350 [Actinobacteria bacterium]|uniref:Unannotated protein n=1 Tax=freshwater metagenome TaxID=449393 RepID=A0A6J6Q210_9ZZZZ|nr:hypothetical protein [Actinomycetota bacterium]